MHARFLQLERAAEEAALLRKQKLWFESELAAKTEALNEQRRAAANERVDAATQVCDLRSA
jgi:hypothetical protein